jgi:putative ABC transport system permease protein
MLYDPGMDAATFLREIKYALRSLARTRGLALTVILTLALGIGANAAIFTLVRGVLLRPLVNRGEDQLVYIRQSAPGIGADNTNFSVPELDDLRASVKSFSEFGDFSVIGFSIIGLGEPREIKAGVVGGSYFETMGLHPVLGRLLDMRDDGPKAAGAVVLTYRFWMSQLHGDPSVIGKTVRLESFGPATSGTIVGVLEPSIPYPADTEIIANIVTSPHHLSATMAKGRVHRMTEFFGRLAPGATLEQARAELNTAYGAMIREHREAYPEQAHFRIGAVKLRDQITSKARTILLVLMGASMLVFVIAVSNVANLILARTVRREGELGIRAALGATNAALRRTLLAESLILCGAGALLGVLSAEPMVSVLARYASRFSVRALDLTVDSSRLWVGVLLAIVAAVLLAYVPRLPSGGSSQGFSLANGSARVTGSTSGKQRVFAVVQVAASFVLLAGASMLLKTLVALQTAQTGIDTRHVLAVNVPTMEYGKTQEQVKEFYRECIRRLMQLPGVDQVALGSAVPWRDVGQDPEFQFTADGHVSNENDPRARWRVISPAYFAALGVPILAGRDFDDRDREGSQGVVIVSQSWAQRMFPGQDAVGRHMTWTDPVMKFVGIEPKPMRIVGVVPDIEDMQVKPGPAVTVYQPFEQALFGGRMFVHVHGYPNALVAPLLRTIRAMSPDQVVERAATLEDIRSEALTPDRLNTIVFGGFAGVALLIAVVGVAGVLAFSVSGRIREFGIRLAIGSQPRDLVARVVGEGAAIAVIGIVAGIVAGMGLMALAHGILSDAQSPGLIVVAGSGVLLLGAAAIASFMPARRAARVDVMQALRSE